MNIKSPTLILAAVCICGAGSAHAETFKQYYKRFIPKFITAFETSDIKFFDEMSTADFTDTEMGRTTKKADALAQMKGQMAATKKMTVKMKLLTVSEKGNTAHATTRMTASMVMKPDQTGKSHTMSMEMVEEESWVKVGSGWKLKALVEGKPSKMMMDGKPMDPSKMGG